MPALYSADPLNAGYFYTEFEKTDEEGLLSNVAMISKGCLNNVLPKAFGKNCLSLQTVTSNSTAQSTGDKVSITVIYLAPVTEYEWIENRIPAANARYAGINNANSPLNLANIIRFSVTGADGGSSGWIPYSDFVAAWNSLSAGPVVTEYEQEILIPGLYWKCRSVTTWMVFGGSGS